MDNKPLEVVSLPITMIKPYWRNPRKNKNIEQVKKSILDYGFTQPITVDSDYVIITGHSRYKAMLELGCQDIPCFVLDLPADKAREYRLADNKIAEESGWDLKMLDIELREAFSTNGNFNIYFPEFKFDMETVAPKATGEQVEEKRLEMNDRFQEMTAAGQSDLVEVICPKCGEVFSIKKSEVLNASR